MLTITGPIADTRDLLYTHEMTGRESGATSRALTSVFASVWTWFAITAACAGIWAFQHRFEVNPDGITYVDMASAATKNGLGSLINGYFCPLYPGFLAIWFWLIHPSPTMEAPLVHFAGWLIFCGAAAAFALFLRALMKLDVRNWREGGVSPAIESLFYYCAFVWIFMRPEFTAVFPDLLLSAFVFLTAWCCVRAVSGASWGCYVLLGLASAGIYYCKASGFFTALFLLATLLVWPPVRNGRPRVVLALLVFSAASLPLVIAVSKRVGEFTTGESGKLNYLWHVEKPNLPQHVNSDFYTYYGWKVAGWTGLQTVGHGTLLHPPRILFEKPLVLEFAGPVGGTYALWYDPAYWFAGVRVRPDLRRQITHSFQNLHSYWLTADNGVLWAGALALAILGASRPLKGWLPPSLFWIVLWPLAMLATIASVHLETRYLAPFVVLLVVGVCAPLARRSGSAANAALLALSIVIILPVAVLTCDSVLAIVDQRTTHFRSDDQQIADALSALGVKPGDRIATVGNSFDAYWAHLAGVRIVAQAPDKDEFWKADQKQQDELVEQLRSVGAKALVARSEGEPARPGWQELPSRVGEPYRLLLLR